MRSLSFVFLTLLAACSGGGDDPPQGTDTDLGVFVADADATSTTDPIVDDTDGDGLLDGEEDTDFDGATTNSIGDSSGNGSGESDPSLSDTDGDGLVDGAEVTAGSSPVDTDTDNGGVDDGTEVLSDGTDVLEPTDDQPDTGVRIWWQGGRPSTAPEASMDQNLRNRLRALGYLD